MSGFSATKSGSRAEHFRDDVSALAVLAERITDTGPLGWAAVDTQYRGRGLAAHLIEAVVAAMRTAGKRRVVTDISSENTASQAMARKTGFTEGISVTFFTKNLSPNSITWHAVPRKVDFGGMFVIVRSVQSPHSRFW